MMRSFNVACVVLALMLSPLASPADAQGKPARLLLTVVDQSGAVVPNATVTATPATDPTKTIGPVKSTEAGLATLEGLARAAERRQTSAPQSSREQ